MKTQRVKNMFKLSQKSDFLCLQVMLILKNMFKLSQKSDFLCFEVYVILKILIDENTESKKYVQIKSEIRLFVFTGYVNSKNMFKLSQKSDFLCLQVMLILKICSN